MRPVLPLLPWLLLLGSCGSPPRPPTVDESLKRPANSAMAVELQVCQTDLHNTRILATESGRIAAVNEAVKARQAALDRAMSALQVPPVQAVPPANSLYTVRFDYRSSRVLVPADIARDLIADARSAPLVLLRGRTDGVTESPGESRIARDRAEAVRDYLIAAGVEPGRIRATYQPVGDHAADNTSSIGRDMNRRVEIEVYRALPVAMAASSASAH